VGGSKVSRRASEFVGVALFAAALIWIIALASYEPSDPVWFFSSGAHGAPANFAGRVGAFLAELSFQLFGYGAYLVPAAMVITGWNYFWCRSLDAAATKATGAVMLLACISAFLSLIFGTLDVSGKAFRAGGYAGEFLANQIFNAALEVHKLLGPGLLESVYEFALVREFQIRDLQVARQAKIPLFYKESDTGKEFFIDILVAGEIVIEIKSVENILPVHQAQLLSYLKLADKRMGFLINFNVPLLKNGLKRFVNKY